MARVLILGAGPNGLSAAVSLQAAGSEVFVHGSPMETWKEKMPEGMILRSTRVSSSIASPADQLSINQYEQQTGNPVDFQPTLKQFLDYAQWFQEEGEVKVDPTKVRSIQKNESGFETILEDGRVLKTESVVLAPGITLFPYIPPEFAALPKSLVSHSSEHHSLAQYAGKDVVVVGKGQSALETAALLYEQGAHVEIITRGSQVSFISDAKKNGILGRITSIPTVKNFLYPPTDLAGPPYNWAIADPAVYRSLPTSEQAKLFVLIGPIGSNNLKARLEEVQVQANTTIQTAYPKGEKLHLELSDHTTRDVDHVFFATGFLPDINQCSFLSDELKGAIAQQNGYPLLTLGYESTSVKGLFVAGALAGLSLGPITRFVCGTYPMMRYMTEAITGSRIGYPDERTRRLIAERNLAFRVYQTSRYIQPGR